MMNASRPTSPWVTNSLPWSSVNSTVALAMSRSSLVVQPENSGTEARWLRYSSRAMAAQLTNLRWAVLRNRWSSPCVMRCASRTAAATGGSVTFIRPKQTRNAASVPFVSVEVALVQWPAEQDRREELRRAGQPRLLLVERGAPPIPTDELEDWIRLPADDLDLRVRVEALRRRTDSDAGLVPVLDDDGVLRLGDRWVSLPPVEARLTAGAARPVRRGRVTRGAGPVRLAGRVARAQRPRRPRAAAPPPARRRSASPSAPCGPAATCSSGPTAAGRWRPIPVARRTPTASAASRSAEPRRPGRSRVV